MKGLFSFQGRLNRAKWWLIGIGVAVVEAIVIGVAMATSGAMMDPSGGMPNFGAAGIVVALVVLVALWINLATSAKRYHDRNKSGWWILIIFVPVIGGLWYLVECGFLKGTAGSNQYGADPLA